MRERESTRYDDRSAPAPSVRMVAATVLVGMFFGAVVAPEPSGTATATSITISADDGVSD